MSHYFSVCLSDQLTFCLLACLSDNEDREKYKCKRYFSHIVDLTKKFNDSERKCFVLQCSAVQCSPIQFRRTGLH